MKATKSAQTILEPAREQEPAQHVEVQLLDDLELALVGGGDSPPDWP